MNAMDSFEITEYDVDILQDDVQFTDNYQTIEQKNRDREITKLLRQYVRSYIEKVETQKEYRKKLLGLCKFVIISFSLVFLAILLHFSFSNTTVDAAEVGSLISICVTFLVSVLGLAQIITKYCFPENDEEYITKIVETIQANDLQNKLANMEKSDKSEQKETESKEKDTTVVKSSSAKTVTVQFCDT